MVALCLVVRVTSLQGLVTVVLALLAAVFSKESGTVFVGLAIGYLVWWNRKLVLPFCGLIVPLLSCWLLLRIQAVGLHGNPRNAPMLFLPLSDRLMNIPAIIEFYVSKTLFRYRLASGYYWYTKLLVSAISIYQS